MAHPTFPFVSDHAPVEICDVWADNLEAEFETIRRLITDGFPIVAIDAKSPGEFTHVFGFPTSEAYYQFIRNVVNRNDLVQLGLAVADHNSLLVDGRVWQFNFRRLDPSFPQFALDFGHLLNNSGAIGNASLSWVTFKGPYDVAYLLKYLGNVQGHPLPPTFQDFEHRCSEFFPGLHNLKDLTRPRIYRELELLASQIGVERITTFPRARSDALLTLQCYFTLMGIPGLEG